MTGAHLLVKTVSDSGGGGLVDDTEDVETGDDTGVLGSLTLRVVEVGRDGDDSVGDGRAKVGLGGLLHLAEDHGRNLLGREGLLLGLVHDLDVGLAVLRDDGEGPVLHVGLDLSVVELAADEPLGVEDRVGGVHGLQTREREGQACGERLESRRRGKVRTTWF